MSSTVLSSKGQIVIQNKPFAKTSIDQAYGFLNYKGKRKSLKEMGKAIESGARKNHDCKT